MPSASNSSIKLPPLVRIGEPISWFCSSTTVFVHAPASPAASAAEKSRAVPARDNKVCCHSQDIFLMCIYFLVLCA